MEKYIYNEQNSLWYELQQLSSCLIKSERRMFPLR